MWREKSWLRSIAIIGMLLNCTMNDALTQLQIKSDWLKTYQTHRTRRTVRGFSHPCEEFTGYLWIWILIIFQVKDNAAVSQRIGKPNKARMQRMDLWFLKIWRLISFTNLQTACQMGVLIPRDITKCRECIHSACGEAYQSQIMIPVRRSWGLQTDGMSRFTAWNLSLCKSWVQQNALRW